jgi:hypothetical protein
MLTSYVFAPFNFYPFLLKLIPPFFFFFFFLREEEEEGTTYKYICVNGNDAKLSVEIKPENSFLLFYYFIFFK